jgi:hypothetical protein
MTSAHYLKIYIYLKLTVKCCLKFFPTFCNVPSVYCYSALCEGCRFSSSGVFRSSTFPWCFVQCLQSGCVLILHSVNFLCFIWHDAYIKFSKNWSIGGKFETTPMPHSGLTSFLMLFRKEDRLETGAEGSIAAWCVCLFKEFYFLRYKAV